MAHDVHDEREPFEFWEQHYGKATQVWSGRVNATLAEVARELPPTRALDLGCGEGGDALWLAARGWRATGVDLSPTAITRARAAAAEHGLDAGFVVADLASWIGAARFRDAAFELVTASFLQSPVELARADILRAAAELVAPGGRLVVLAHGAPPSWAAGNSSSLRFPQPDDELRDLGLDEARWRVEAAELRTRAANGPTGEPGWHTDSLLVAQRL